MQNVCKKKKKKKIIGEIDRSAPVDSDNAFLKDIL